jgi:hypothetical protein
MKGRTKGNGTTDADVTRLAGELAAETAAHKATKARLVAVERERDEEYAAGCELGAELDRVRTLLAEATAQSLAAAADYLTTPEPPTHGDKAADYERLPTRTEIERRT